MIRKMEKKDLDRVSKIWLDTNIKAHDFIPAQYWEKNYEPVREMLPQAEVYVWEEDGYTYIYWVCTRSILQGFLSWNRHSPKGSAGSF